MSPYASALFPNGFSDSTGLDNASWCGVLAIGLALLMCICLIRAERCRLDRGTYVVIAAAVLLALDWRIMAGGASALVLLAWRTSLVFSVQDRREISLHTGRVFNHLPRPWRHRSGGG